MVAARQSSACDDRLSAVLCLVFLYYLRSWVTVGRDPDERRHRAALGCRPTAFHRRSGQLCRQQGLFRCRMGQRCRRRCWSLRSRAMWCLRTWRRRSSSSAPTRRVRGKAARPARRSLLDVRSAIRAMSLKIDKANGKRVQSVGTALPLMRSRRSIAGKYYLANTGYIVGGVVLSMCSRLAALLMFGTLFRRYDQGCSLRRS